MRRKGNLLLRWVSTLLIFLCAVSFSAADAEAAKVKKKKKEKQAETQKKIAAQAAEKQAVPRAPIFNPPRVQIPPPGYRPPTAENVSQQATPIFNPPPSQDLPRGFNLPGTVTTSEADRAAQIRDLKAERAKLAKAGALPSELKTFDDQIKSLERAVGTARKAAEATRKAQGPESAVAAQGAMEAAKAASKAR